MRTKHLIQTLRHKWYVLVAGLRLNVSLWRLLKHDVSKWSAAEFGPYARQFHGDRGDPEGFARAWLHHQNTNDHHPEYWVGRTPHCKGNDEAGPLPMPIEAVREMVADWLAAGKVYEGRWPDPNNWTWFEKNRHKMQMHPLTWARLFIVIDKAAKLKW
jgi:hypothetical protein